MNRRQFLKLGAAAAGGLALGACRKAILRTNFSPYEEGHQAWAEAEALRNYVEALINRLESSTAGEYLPEGCYFWVEADLQRGTVNMIGSPNLALWTELKEAQEMYLANTDRELTLGGSNPFNPVFKHPGYYVYSSNYGDVLIGVGAGTPLFMMEYDPFNQNGTLFYTTLNPDGGYDNINRASEFTASPSGGITSDSIIYRDSAYLFDPAYITLQSGLPLVDEERKLISSLIE